MADVQTAATRAAMAALPSPAPGQAVLLTELGREGLFICRAGVAPSDPLQGLYVAATAGTSLYYARVWDQVNGRPEWFGAVANGPDCLAALQAAITLCPVTNLANDDYFLSDTLKILVEKRKLVGQRGRARARLEGSRLIVRSATVDTLQIGPTTLPSGGINAFLKDVTLSSVTLTRDRVPNISFQGSQQPAGLRCRYLLNAEVEHVFASEHAIDFYYGGLVASRFLDCRAIRSLAGVGPVDFWWGHYLDGTLTGVSSGGNASISLDKCTAEYGLNVSGDVVGLIADGAFADTFVRDFETSATKTGIIVKGTGSSGSATGNLNLFIDHPVLDGCSLNGLEIFNVAPGGVVTVRDPYVAIAGASAFACYHIHDGNGSVLISGGQAICFVNSATGGNGLGVHVSNQNGLVISDVAIVGSKRPLALLNCSDCRIAPVIENLTITAEEGSCYLFQSTRVKVEPRVVGGTNRFPAGVKLVGTGNSRVEVNWTEIEDSSISGGSINRLTVNGTSITRVGPFSGGTVSV